MARVLSLVFVVVAGIAMWLALVRPDLDEDDQVSASSEEPTAAVYAPQTVPAEPQPPQPEAAVAKPEEAPKEPATAPSPAVPSGPKAWPQGDLLEGRKGPVDEWQTLYESQTRDAASTEIEVGIRNSFISHSTRPDLLHSASCREGMCKLLIRWAPDRARDYIQGMRWLALGSPWPPGQTGFESRVAYTAASAPDQDGVRLVEVYLKRRSPSAPEPSHVR